MSTEAGFVTWVTNAVADVQKKFPGGTIVDAIATKQPSTTSTVKGAYNLTIASIFTVNAGKSEVTVTGRQDSSDFKYSEPTTATGDDDFVNLRPGAVRDASKIKDPSKVEGFDKTLKDYVSFRMFKFGGAPDSKRPPQPYYEFRDAKAKPIGTKVYGAEDLKAY